MLGFQKLSGRRRAISTLAWATLCASSVSLLANAEETPTAGAAPPVITFSGLRVYEDGSSTLRVSMTKKTPVEFSQSGKSLTFLMKGAKVELRNNKNPLRAEHFQSNVVRTKLDNEKSGARLRVELRSAVQPQHQMIQHSGGATLRIDIPPPAKK